MSPIPNKGFFDPPEPVKLDSVRHNEERAAQIRAADKAQRDEQAQREAKMREDQEFRELEARENDIKFLEDNLKTATQPDTREMILERIRQMREVKPVELPVVPRNAALQEQFEREQAAGRAFVAQAEAERERTQEARRKYEEEERKRLGTMETVYRSNEVEPKAVKAPKK